MHIWLAFSWFVLLVTTMSCIFNYNKFDHKNHQLFGICESEYLNETKNVPFDCPLAIATIIVFLTNLNFVIIVGLSIGIWSSPVIPVIYLFLTFFDIISSYCGIFRRDIDLNILAIQGMPSMIIDYVWILFNFAVVSRSIFMLFNL